LIILLKEFGKAYNYAEFILKEKLMPLI